MSLLSDPAFLAIFFDGACSEKSYARHNLGGDSPRVGEGPGKALGRRCQGMGAMIFERFTERLASRENRYYYMRSSI